MKPEDLKEMNKQAKRNPEAEREQAFNEARIKRALEEEERENRRLAYLRKESYKKPAKNWKIGR